MAVPVEQVTGGWEMDLKVAVMGCVVNGPGEAKEADLGIAGGKSGCVLFRRGQAPEKVTGDPQEALINALLELRE